MKAEAYWKEYERRVQIYEEEGCTRSDAQASEMKLNFFRFESAEGLGMYQVPNAGFLLFDFNADHPGFFSDSTLSRTFRSIYGHWEFQDFIFGFKSYAQILKWIPENHLESTFKNMEKKGVFCYGYYSNETIVGGYQAITRKESARRGRKIGFKTLMKRIEESS